MTKFKSWLLIGCLFVVAIAFAFEMFTYNYALAMLNLALVIPAMMNKKFLNNLFGNI